MVLKDKLKKLGAKKEKVTVDPVDEESFDIQVMGLTFDELTQMAEFEKNKDVRGAMNFLLFSTVKKSIELEGEECTEEEVNNIVKIISTENATTIIKKVQELSGLVDEKDKKN